MSDGMSDALLGAVIGSSIATSGNAAQTQQMLVEQRAKTVGDMYGATPPSLDLYRKQTGQTTRFGKMLVAAAAGAVIVVAAAAGIVAIAGGVLTGGILGTPALLIAGCGAVLGAIASAESDRFNAVQNYDNFIGEFAKNARAVNEAHIRHRQWTR